MSQIFGDGAENFFFDAALFAKANVAQFLFKWTRVAHYHFVSGCTLAFVKSRSILWHFPRRWPDFHFFVLVFRNFVTPDAQITRLLIYFAGQDCWWTDLLLLSQQQQIGFVGIQLTIWIVLVRPFGFIMADATMRPLFGLLLLLKEKIEQLWCFASLAFLQLLPKLKK